MLVYCVTCVESGNKFSITYFFTFEEKHKMFLLTYIIVSLSKLQMNIRVFQ